MFGGFCGFGNWGSAGTFGVLGGIGLMLYLLFWGGLLTGLILFVVRAFRRARISTGSDSFATGQPTAKEILRAQYARGEITREQYERMKRDIE